MESPYAYLYEFRYDLQGPNNKTLDFLTPNVSGAPQYVTTYCRIEQ